MLDPALVDYLAQITSAYAEIEAMKALNTYREMRGETIAYDEHAFMDVSTRLRGISEAIGRLYSQ